jgi:hypothetical protein
MTHIFPKDYGSCGGSITVNNPAIPAATIKNTGKYSYVL